MATLRAGQAELRAVVPHRCLKGKEVGAVSRAPTSQSKAALEPPKRRRSAASLRGGHTSRWTVPKSSKYCLVLDEASTGSINRCQLLSTKAGIAQGTDVIGNLADLRGAD